MGLIYNGIAVALNDSENHRTDTDYEDALIAKTFVFQFVNSFCSLFYIAFIKTHIESCTTSCMQVRHLADPTPHHPKSHESQPRRWAHPYPSPQAPKSPLLVSWGRSLMHAPSVNL